MVVVNDTTGFNTVVIAPSRSEGRLAIRTYKKGTFMSQASCSPTRQSILQVLDWQLKMMGIPEE